MQRCVSLKVVCSRETGSEGDQESDGVDTGCSVAGPHQWSHPVAVRRVHILTLGNQISDNSRVAELSGQVHGGTALPVPEAGVGPGGHQEDDDANVTLSAGPVEGGGHQLPAHSVHISTLFDVVANYLLPVVDGCPVKQSHILTVTLVNIKPTLNNLLNSFKCTILSCFDYVKTAGILFRNNRLFMSRSRRGC